MNVVARVTDQRHHIARLQPGPGHVGPVDEDDGAGALQPPQTVAEAVNRGVELVVRAHGDQVVAPGRRAHAQRRHDGRHRELGLATVCLPHALVGAVATVDMKDVSKTRIADVAQALQGQVAGVFVAANTGAPGDGIKIRIRGEGTLGNNEVLYVVDGVPTRDISFLNVTDVKSMTVLKDAAASAIYGSRAAGGVVVITTNSGQRGKTSIDVDYFSGFYTATNLPKMLNADQYLTVKDMAWHNTLGNTATAVSPYKADRSRTDLANTDWLNELFNTGKSQSLQVSASGGSESVQYLLSAGYF